MLPMSRPEKISWPTVVIVHNGGSHASHEAGAREWRPRTAVSPHRWLHGGSGTIIISWVARLMGNTWLFPDFCHCQTPIEARRFCPASFGSGGQSLLVNLMPLPLARAPGGRSSLSAISRNSSGSRVLALGKTSVNRAQVAEKLDDAWPAGGRFILSSLRLKNSSATLTVSGRSAFGFTLAAKSDTNIPFTMSPMESRRSGLE